MLAILAALTEVIKERGGSQSSTEYFLALVIRNIVMLCCVHDLIVYVYIADGNAGCC